jgi:hypothetical protein
MTRILQVFGRRVVVFVIVFLSFFSLGFRTVKSSRKSAERIHIIATLGRCTHRLCSRVVANRSHVKYSGHQCRHPHCCQHGKAPLVLLPHT